MTKRARTREIVSVVENVEPMQNTPREKGVAISLHVPSSARDVF